jgi:AcrR family transcriptional regulator
VTRKYELRKRADGVADTRRRIVEATVEFHRTVGPARTRVSEIARRTGLRRVTVYDHFPDDSALIAACSAHWRSLHPVPDPTGWAEIEPPAARLRTALLAVYRWYRETEPMTANVLRDAETVPALRAILDDGLFAWLAAVRTTLEAAFATPDGVPQRVGAAIRVAVDFHAWLALAPLGDAEAAELAGRLVECASASGDVAG